MGSFCVGVNLGVGRGHREGRPDVGSWQLLAFRGRFRHRSLTMSFPIKPARSPTSNSTPTTAGDREKSATMPSSSMGSTIMSISATTRSPRPLVSRRGWIFTASAASARTLWPSLSTFSGRRRPTMARPPSCSPMAQWVLRSATRRETSMSYRPLPESSQPRHLASDRLSPRHQRLGYGVNLRGRRSARCGHHPVALE